MKQTRTKTTLWTNQKRWNANTTDERLNKQFNLKKKLLSYISWDYAGHSAAWVEYKKEKNACCIRMLPKYNTDNTELCDLTSPATSLCWAMEEDMNVMYPNQVKKEKKLTQDVLGNMNALCQEQI